MTTDFIKHRSKVIDVFTNLMIYRGFSKVRFWFNISLCFWLKLLERSTNNFYPQESPDYNCSFVYTRKIFVNRIAVDVFVVFRVWYPDDYVFSGLSDRKELAIIPMVSYCLSGHYGCMVVLPREKIYKHIEDSLSVVDAAIKPPDSIISACFEKLDKKNQSKSKLFIFRKK